MMGVKRERGESSRRNDSRGEGDVQSLGGTPAPSQRMGGTPAPSQRMGRTRTSSQRMVLPPKQSESDRRRVRSHYRELRTQVNDRKGELAQADFGEFQEIVQRAEKLHGRGLKPREQISDAELLMDITSEILDVAKGAQIKGGMSAPEFVGAIIHAYNSASVNDDDSSQSLHWESLGLEACVILRQAPGISTMVGPMDVELKTRKTMTRGRRERPTERTRPQTVKEIDPDAPNVETDANMKIMFEVLKENSEVRVDYLVLNRRSFAQTIENLFALSFLVKDGRVRYNVSGGGIQTVVPCDAPSHEDRTERAIVNYQFVFRMDHQCWQLMKEQVPEGEECMPHRGSQEEAPEGEETMPNGGSREQAPESLPKARTPIRKNSRNRARETPAVSPPGDSPEEASGSGSGTSRFKRRLVLP